MAAGDAQRVWLTEMIDRLRSQWQEGMPFEAIVELRDELDAMLQEIRWQRHIRPPLIKCPQCGHVGEGAEPHLSVRAMILALRRFGMADAERVHALEKAWAGHRKRNGLDPNGKGLESDAVPAAGCAHRKVK